MYTRSREAIKEIYTRLSGELVGSRPAKGTQFYERFRAGNPAEMTITRVQPAADQHGGELNLNTWVITLSDPDGNWIEVPLGMIVPHQVILQYALRFLGEHEITTALKDGQAVYESPLTPAERYQQSKQAAISVGWRHTHFNVTIDWGKEQELAQAVGALFDSETRGVIKGSALIPHLKAVLCKLLNSSELFQQGPEPRYNFENDYFVDASQAAVAISRSNFDYVQITTDCRTEKQSQELQYLRSNLTLHRAYPKPHTK